MSLRDLSYGEKLNLCNILDNSNCFYELGSTHMQFDESTLQSFQEFSKKHNSSLSEKLLDEWDTYGHSILELFILLNRLKLYSAMTILRRHVDSKYHYLIKVEKPENKIVNGPLVDTRDDNITSNSPKISDESSGTIPMIHYEELRHSTNNWDSSNVLGRGGFGMVFRGLWKCTQVAIKRIEKREDSPESSYEQIVQSNTELHCLNSYRHDNILPLYGYSIGGPQPCLVYQYMPGGSLDHRLHSRILLPWQNRLEIAIGTARGLQFLHTIRLKPLIHGDIKSANILLDAFGVPRIGDFGLAREGPIEEYIKVTRIHGTRPYLPEEFIKYRKFSTKVDTYSFGVVLFELATSLSAYSARREDKFLKDHVVNFDKERIIELMDDKGGDDQGGCFETLLSVGKDCVKDLAKNRPEMVEVLVMLESK